MSDSQRARGAPMPEGGSSPEGARATADDEEPAVNTPRVDDALAAGTEEAIVPLDELGPLDSVPPDAPPDTFVPGDDDDAALDSWHDEEFEPQGAGEPEREDAPPDPVDDPAPFGAVTLGELYASNEPDAFPLGARLRVALDLLEELIALGSDEAIHERDERSVLTLDALLLDERGRARLDDEAREGDHSGAGVLVWEVLAARPAATRSGPLPLLLEHALEVVPDVLVTVARALEDDPAERFTSVAAFAEAIQGSAGPAMFTHEQVAVSLRTMRPHQHTTIPPAGDDGIEPVVAPPPPAMRGLAAEMLATLSASSRVQAHLDPSPSPAPVEPGASAGTSAPPHDTHVVAASTADVSDAPSPSPVAEARPLDGAARVDPPPPRHHPLVSWPPGGGSAGTTAAPAGEVAAQLSAPPEPARDGEGDLRAPTDAPAPPGEPRRSERVPRRGDTPRPPPVTPVVRGPTHAPARPMAPVERPSPGRGLLLGIGAVVAIAAGYVLFGGSGSPSDAPTTTRPTSPPVNTVPTSPPRAAPPRESPRPPPPVAPSPAPSATAVEAAPPRAPASTSAPLAAPPATGEKHPAPPPVATSAPPVRPVEAPPPRPRPIRPKTSRPHEGVHSPGY